MENPISYSKFIQPDDSVTKLITQLETLAATYDDLLRTVLNDAKKLEDQLKKTSGATTEGQEETKKAAEETARLKKAQDDLTKSQSDTVKEITKLKAQQQEQNNINKLTTKLNESAKGSYNALSAQYSLNKMALNKMSKEERESTKHGRKLEKDTKALNDEMKRLQANVGNTSLNVGNYKEALESVPGPLAGVVSGTKAVGKQFLTLMANPIVALIALIAGTFMLLYKGMQRSEEGQARLNKIMNIASAIFGTIMNIVTEIAVALFDSFPKILQKAGNYFKIFANELEAGFIKIRIRWNEFMGDTTEANELKKKLQTVTAETANLRLEQDKLGDAIAANFAGASNLINNFGKTLEKNLKLAEELSKKEDKFNKDQRKYIVENAKLSKEAAKLREEAEDTKLLNADLSIKKAKEAFDLDEKILANDLNLAKQERSIANMKSAMSADTIEDKKELAELDAKVINLETQYNEKRKGNIKQLNKLRKEAFDQEKERLKIQNELNEIEVSAVIRKNNNIIENQFSSLEQRQKAALENAQFESNMVKSSTDLELKELDKRNELKLIGEEDYLAQKKLLEKKSEDEILKISENLTKKQIDITQNQIAIDKSRFDAKVDMINSDNDLANSEIDLMNATEAEKTRLRLKAEKDRLQKILDLNDAMGLKLSANELSIIKNTMTKIDEEMNKPRQYADIYEVVGLNLTDDRKEAINTSTQFAIDAVNTFLAARVAAADAAVAASEKEVDSTKSRLDSEIQARNNGYASNVAQAQKDLDLARKTQDKALKEQEKAKKAQLAMDTVVQASSLITASANIWKSLSSIPYVGWALAIAALGVMWGSFAYSKIKASQMTKQSYGEGGLEFLDGGSHASGNDIPIGMTRDGKDRRAEGGEALAIIRKSQTRKYRKMLPGIIGALNKGIFEEKYMNSYDTGGMSINMSSNTNLKELEKDVKAIKEQGERKYYTDSKGRIIETYKNLRRIYVS